MVRGVSGAERAPAPRVPPRAIAIPTPEELGIATASTGRREELDWAATRRQMQQLGVLRFELQNQEGGRAMFTCWVPCPTGPRKFQASGSSEASAVRDCLALARQVTPPR